MRAIVGMLGLVTLGYVLVRLAGGPFPPSLTTSSLLVALVGLAAMLLALAAVPHAIAGKCGAPRLATPGGLAAATLVALALFFVFGIGTLVSTASIIDHPEQDQQLDQVTLLVSLAINMVVFILPAAAWASSAEGERGARAWAWLGLRRRGATWSLIWAGLAVLLVFWLLIAAGLAVKSLGGQDLENQRAEAIAKALSAPAVPLVAAMTGVGEEIFFRGFLLKKVGNVPQAVLFGLAHLNYLAPLEVGVTAALGYGFGRTVKRTGSLWGPIVGHALFNAVSLFIVLYRTAPGPV
jgi:membrane protease YdiL (CAAX protease family)